MRHIVCLTICALSVTGPAFAQAPSSDSPEDGISIVTLLQNVAGSTDKKFIVDPRVRAHVTLLGMNANKLSYADLHNVLTLHGFAAYESGGLVHVVPSANIRYLPVPTVRANAKFADGEVVSSVITVKSLPAAQLVPLLRPMLPQFAHLAALACTNSLIMVDQFANVKRLEAIVESIDKGEPYRPRCAGEEAAK